jgi:hypothetical protein
MVTKSPSKTNSPSKHKSPSKIQSTSKLNSPSKTKTSSKHNSPSKIKGLCIRIFIMLLEFLCFLDKKQEVTKHKK